MNTNRITLVLLILFMLPAVANAETSVSGCSTLNVTGETYILTEDIIDSGASICMDIKANDVTLDCQGHRIDGINRTNSKGVSKYYNNIGRHAVVKNCVFSDWYTGIYIHSSDGANVTGNTVESSSTGILVQNSLGSVVSKNEVNGYIAEGIAMRQSDNSVVSSNKITGTEGISTPGITAHYNTSNLLIEDNEITGFGGWGIDLYMLVDGGGNVISRNVIRDAKPRAGGLSGCIYVFDPKGAEIKNNVTENCGSYGVFVVGLYFTISQNESSRNAVGISVAWPWEGGGSTLSTVQDNIVHDNMKGIWFQSNENIMSNNSIYRNVTGISVLDAHSNKIRNNRVYENDNGASILSSLNTVFEDNTVTENKHSGVLLSTGGGLVLTGNTVCGNGDYDIYLYTNTPPFDYTGSGNRCQTVLGWHDDAVKEGCTFKCLNNPPVAEAGPDQTVQCSGSGATVRLDGSGSSDPDNDPLTYTWTWPGGSAEGVSPTPTFPLGTAKATLLVDDGNGGTGSDTVSITVQDTTPPVTTVRSIAGVAGNNGWYRSDVLITVDSTDTCSGVREIRSIVDGAAAVTPGSAAAIPVRGDMIHNVSFYAADNAGAPEQPQFLTIKVDQTPPIITAAVSPDPNARGWHNTDVTVTFTCSDTLSGMASCPAPVTVTTEGSGQIITGEAVDKAGNNATTSVTLKIDKTGPVITVNGVQNGAIYELGLVPSASYGATDAPSGVAASSAVLTGGDGLGLGMFNYTVTVTDNAGNTSVMTVTYRVIATPNGLLALLESLVASGQVDPNIGGALAAKIKGVLDANGTAADGKLQAFINQINAQVGKKITPEAAAILINAARYMMNNN